MCINKICSECGDDKREGECEQIEQKKNAYKKGLATNETFNSCEN